MQKFACPSCGAAIVLQSSMSVSTVCTYCQSLLLRTDTDLAQMGRVAALTDDLTPFQLGSQGVYDGISFTLIGRRRMGWNDGFWTEWFFAGEDGRKGWLAEAQGTFGVCYESEAPLPSFTQRLLKEMVEAKSDGAKALDRRVELEGKTYSVADRKSAICLGCEGELPMLANPGRRSTCIDFVGGPEEFASVEGYEDKISVYLGRYVTWDDLKISFGREIEGWS